MSAEGEQAANSKPSPKFRHVLWSSILVLVLVLTCILYGTLGARRHYKPVHRHNQFSGRTIEVHSFLVSVDGGTGRVLLGWQIVADSACDGTPDASACSPVDIFFDGVLAVDDSGATVKPNDTEPIFTWDPNPSRSYAKKDSFRTMVLARPFTALQYYPWDEFRTTIFLTAQIPGTNTSVGLDVGVFAGQAIGFYVSTKSESPAALNIPPGVFYEELIIKRAAHVKAYAIVIMITVWTISLVFIFATSMHLAFGYAMGSDFLVIPIGTLFTVTSLRSTLPGAPDFGTILDYVALLPCLALLSVCATLTLATLAFADHDRQRKPLLHGLFLRWRERPFFRKKQANDQANDQADNQA